MQPFFIFRRSFLLVRFYLTKSLCNLLRGVKTRVLPGLVGPTTQRAADLVRLRWLEGRVASGLGQTDAALRALEEARSGFASQAMHYDVALTLLETAAIHLERGELATVQVLAGELAAIFEAKGVHVHALAALRLFVEAVARQTATAVLARCLLDYLFRARHDEKLQFSLSVVDPPRRGSV
jgi:hypothetical protein